MTRIYIVGFMGSGKTTIAKRLANHLGMEWYDTDRMFEERFHISVNDFFQKYDEPLYRRLETEMLHSTEQFNQAIVSTGGGTACFNDNMEWMNQHGLTLFLKVSPLTAYDRLLHAKVKRPLAVNKTPEELLAFVNECFAERLPFYEQAQLTIKGEDLDLNQVIATIQGLINPSSTPIM
ncbi:MAG: AAA family ATPase [Bacteroidales bacterium]|nr:AAA family ATPase [Bacteroidales bacterium]